MKIKKIEIENFGKFQNYVCSFTNGMNLISRPNEYGKTTIMSFIYLMFYSKLPNESSQDVQKSLRRKYRPWNQNKMSGRIEFIANDITYSLHKTFGKSIGSDEIQLVNMDTGEEIKLGRDEEVGRRFFLLDAAGFEKSVFISCTGGFTGEGSRDIALRLSSIISTGDEEVSGSAVMKRITDAREKLVSKSGRKGLLTELKIKQDSLIQKQKENAEQSELMAEKETKLQEYKNVNSQFNIRKQDIDRKLDVIARTSRISEYKKIADADMQLKGNKPAIDVDAASKIMAEIELTEHLLREQTSGFNDNLIMIDEDEYNKFLQNISIRDNCVNVKEFIENSLIPSKESYEEAKSRLNDVPEDQKAVRSKEIVFSAAGAVLVIAAVVMTVLSRYIVAGAIGVIAVVVIIYSFVKMNTSKKTHKEEHRRRMEEHDRAAVDTGRQKARVDELTRILADKMRTGVITDINEAINENARKLYHAKEGIEKLLQETGYREDEIQKAYSDSVAAISIRKSINTTKEKLGMLKDSFTKLVNNSVQSDNYEQALSIYNEELGKALNCKELNNQIRLMSEVNRINPEEAEDRYLECRQLLLKEGLELGNIELLKHNLTNERADIEHKLAAGNELIFELGRQMNTGTMDPEELDRELTECKEELSDMSEYFDALQVAEKYMKLSVEEAGSTFGPELNRRTSEIFSKITGEKYNTLMIDQEYKISVKEDIGAFHEWKYLSNGTIDQAYLALRLALTGIVTQDEEPLPLLLDDVFIQYDAERKQRAMEYIEEYAKTAQVIYFTT